MGKYIIALLFSISVYAQCVSEGITIDYHQFNACTTKYNRHYEVYADSLFEVEANWMECVCFRCGKQMKIGYKSYRTLLWRRDE